MSHTLAYDVLGLGVIAVDDLLYVDEYPAAEAKVRVRRRERQCGGQTGTALVAAARMGARCAYVGTLGGDALSETVAEQFRREGIALEHAVRRDDAQPCHSTIIVDRRHKTRTIFSSHEGYGGADPQRPSAETIASGAVLLIDHHQVEATLRTARIARQAGRSVVADFERVPDGPFKELLALVDHLVVPEAFARALADASTAADAAVRLMAPGRAAVVVTCGRQGCWYASGASGSPPVYFPARDVDVVDTTGCGDVFHGAYAAALARGWPLPRCVELASTAAALKATQPGGQEGIPTLQAVKKWLVDSG